MVISDACLLFSGCTKIESESKSYITYKYLLPLDDVNGKLPVRSPYESSFSDHGTNLEHTVNCFVLGSSCCGKKSSLLGVVEAWWIED